MFHYIENKNYNLNNDEYKKFNKQTSQYKQEKSIVQNNQGPVQNFNLYNKSINENFNKKDNDQIKLQSQYQLNIIENNTYIDPTDFYYDKLKYERNNDLEKFKEIQGGFYIN